MKKIYKPLIVISVVILIYAILQIIGITCPIKYIFGVSCPGCGMTRAVISAVTFKFERAFFFHPLWFAMPVFLALYLYARIKNKTKLEKIVVCTFVISILSVYVVRAIFFQSEIVCFSWKNGLIYKLFN